MPLPDSGLPWPPKQLEQVTAKHAEWDAWYAGDTSRLQGVYALDRPGVDRPAQFRGGVGGALARFWWGRPVGADGRHDDRLHVPIASDLCQASADLLYAEPPSVISTDKTVQTNLDTAVEEGLIGVLAGASEIGAALGDVYLRTSWDRTVADRSFVTAVHADAAWPTFRWGRLVAVTFWWVVRVEGQVIWRKLERHELDNNGIGVIFHGLYEGTVNNLGQVVPLADDPSTADIQVDADSKVSTETPGLAVVHVPNQRPQRRWRNDPIGAHLGRSDLDGVESLMDKLDMVYTSWMRDVRLAKSRLIVPDYMLQSPGPGRGAFFDDDQDVFTRLNAPPREDGKSEITPQQFTIRVTEHQQTAQQLISDILRTSGYSQQTFGEGSDVAVTATEVTAKDRRSALTRDRKIRNVQPALVRILRKKLQVDNVIFRAGLKADADVAVEFVDVTQADPAVLASSADMLFRAQSASAETRVRMLHPDWDEPAVAAEVGRIQAEFSVAVPDPTEFRPGDASAVPPVGSQDAGQP